MHSNGSRRRGREYRCSYEVVRRTVTATRRRTPDRGYHHTDLRILLPRLRSPLRGPDPWRGNAGMPGVQERLSGASVFASHRAHVRNPGHGHAGREGAGQASGSGADACAARVRAEPRRSLVVGRRGLRRPRRPPPFQAGRWGSRRDASDRGHVRDRRDVSMLAGLR